MPLALPGSITERHQDMTSAPSWFRPRVRIETMPNPGREPLARVPVQMLSA